MKNNTFFKLFIIFLIAILFRMCFLDKPEGLWNDEYVSWYIASIKDWHLFVAKMMQNCHTPFYYLYLKFWMFCFPDTDYSLRVSSVIPSLISVVVMFLAGKSLKNVKVGLLCAFFTAISSFCIYFAQEVRLYSLLFLFSALSILYFIEAAKSPSKLNLFLFMLFQSLIIFTHTLGIIYSLPAIAALYLYLKNNSDVAFFKKNFVSFSVVFCLTFLLLLPILYKIAASDSISQFWSGFSLSKILFVFVDYFSPIQTNIVNSPNSFLSYVYKAHSIRYLFVIFALIPVAIAFYGILNSFKSKNKIYNYLFSASCVFFLVLVLLAASHKMILITKYSTEIYPVLLLAISLGFSEIKNINLRNILVAVFVFIQLFYLCNASDAVYKRNRTEGNKIVAELIKNSRLKTGDIVLLTYYDVDKFERYLPDINQFRFLSVNKYNFNYFMFNGENYKQLQKNGKFEKKDYFAEFPNKQILSYSKDYIIYKTQIGDRVGVVFLNTVSFLSNDMIQQILKDDKKLKYTPFVFLVFSAFKNNIMYSLKDTFKVDSITEYGDWTLVVFEKVN